jgi:hypothetical protein
MVTVLNRDLSDHGSRNYMLGDSSADGKANVII